MITLKSSDGEEFEVEETMAMESHTIRHMIEDDYADSGIPLPNINKHVHAAPKPSDDNNNNDATTNASASRGEDLKNWDADFVKVDVGHTLRPHPVGFEDWQ